MLRKKKTANLKLIDIRRKNIFSNTSDDDKDEKNEVESEEKFEFLIEITQGKKKRKKWFNELKTKLSYPKIKMMVQKFEDTIIDCLECDYLENFASKNFSPLKIF